MSEQKRVSKAKIKWQIASMEKELQEAEARNKVQFKCPNFVKVLYLEIQIQILLGSQHVYWVVLPLLEPRPSENVEALALEEQMNCELGKIEAELTMIDNKINRICRDCEKNNKSCSIQLYFPPITSMFGA